MHPQTAYQAILSDSPTSLKHELMFHVFDGDRWEKIAKGPDGPSAQFHSTDGPIGGNGMFVL
jgi:hypothetical protein